MVTMFVLIRVTILQSGPKPLKRGRPEQCASGPVMCPMVRDRRLVTCSRAVNILLTKTTIALPCHYYRDRKTLPSEELLSQYNPVKGLYGSWPTPALYQGRSTRV